jgi:hypothetical protein
MTVETVKKVKYHLGQHYSLSECYEPEGYVLAQVVEHQVALVGMRSGNRYNNPVKVKTAYDISEEEFAEISEVKEDGEFYPIDLNEEHVCGKGTCNCDMIEESIPEVIPQILVTFKHRGKMIACNLWVKKKLRVGIAFCSDKDEFNQFRGEKMALKRAIDQHGMGKLIRGALWAQYLVYRNVAIDNSIKATLKWFKSGKVKFRL